jgi:hypothetical protein
MTNLTPIDHDPWAEEPVPKEGQAVPHDVVRSAITDYPVVQAVGRNIASAVTEPVMQMGRLLTQGTADPNLAEDTEGAILGMAPIGKLAPLASIFAGIGAKTADREALSLAQQMLAKGHAAEDIWKATGWFQGADEKWRFEIPDTKSFEAAGRYSVGSRVHHPKLFEAYPDLAHVKVRDDSSLEHAAAEYQAPWLNMPESITMGKGSAHDAMLHELMHAIQEREGFAKGGNPEMLKEIAWEVLSADKDFPSDREVNKFANEAYMRLAGEVEARNVEARMRGSALPPWETEDRPRNKQTVIGVKLTPVDHDPFRGEPPKGP